MSWSAALLVTVLVSGSVGVILGVVLVWLQASF